MFTLVLATSMHAGTSSSVHGSMAATGTLAAAVARRPLLGPPRCAPRGRPTTPGRRPLALQPFCKPPEGVRRMANTANLGTILQGLRIENSPYNFTVMVRTRAASRAPASSAHGHGRF